MTTSTPQGNPNLRSQPPPQILDKSGLQKIRGAFFLFLIPFFAAIWAGVTAVASAVMAAVTAVAATIGGILNTVIGAIALTIQSAIGAIVGGLQFLAGTFLGFTTQLLSCIPFVGPVLASVVGAVGNVAIGIISTAVGFVSTYLVPFSSTALMHAVKCGRPQKGSASR